MEAAITVVGSVNLDFVATARTLPAPGETVTGAALARHPGGKGANQALAAARLSARVSLIARVGADALADEALALLKAEGVNLSGCLIDESAPTGVALIAVDAKGNHQVTNFRCQGPIRYWFWEDSMPEPELRDAMTA